MLFFKVLFEIFRVAVKGTQRGCGLPRAAWCVGPGVEAPDSLSFSPSHHALSPLEGSVCALVSAQASRTKAVAFA